MATQNQRLICLDASVLIEYFRKQKKEETLFFKLTKVSSHFLVPVIVHFEVFSGSNENQNEYWEDLFSDFSILSFSTEMSFVGIGIKEQLKKIRTTIEIKNLLIAATVLYHNAPLATINVRHFDKIETLQLITPNDFSE